MGRIELKNNPSFKPLTLANFRELFAFLKFFSCGVAQIRGYFGVASA